MDGEFLCGYISQYDNIIYYRLEIFSTLASVAMGRGAGGRVGKAALPVLFASECCLKGLR